MRPKEAETRPCYAAGCSSTATSRWKQAPARPPTPATHRYLDAAHQGAQEVGQGGGACMQTRGGERGTLECKACWTARAAGATCVGARPWYICSSRELLAHPCLCPPAWAAHPPGSGRPPCEPACWHSLPDPPRWLRRSRVGGRRSFQSGGVLPAAACRCCCDVAAALPQLSRRGAAAGATALHCTTQAWEHLCSHAVSHPGHQTRAHPTLHKLWRPARALQAQLQPNSGACSSHPAGQRTGRASKDGLGTQHGDLEGCGLGMQARSEVGEGVAWPLGFLLAALLGG